MLAKRVACAAKRRLLILLVFALLVTSLGGSAQAAQKTGSQVRAGTRTYRLYNQASADGYYLYSRGCVITAIAIAASGYGKRYSPSTIQYGSVKSSYSVRHALQQLKVNMGLYNTQIITIRTAAKIFSNMGIPNKPVYRFTTKSAVKQIAAHLKTGNAVLIKANNRKVNGIRLANSHHAMVVIGMDKKGYVRVIDPFYGKVNYAHPVKKHFKMKLQTLVKYHMSSYTGSQSSAYITSMGVSGGYILLGKK